MVVVVIPLDQNTLLGRSVPTKSLVIAETKPNTSKKEDRSHQKKRPSALHLCVCAFWGVVKQILVLLLYKYSVIIIHEIEILAQVKHKHKQQRQCCRSLSLSSEIPTQSIDDTKLCVPVPRLLDR